MTAAREVFAVGHTAALPISHERSLVSTTIPSPEPGPRDVLVRVQAVSVNPVDVKLRASAEPSGGLRVLGFDGAGTVEAVGSDVTMFTAGDEVFYAGAIDRAGSNAAFQVVDERIVARKPRSLSFAEAAALPLTALTAWESVFDKLRLGRDATGTVLIVGGAGGVGSVAIQLFKQLIPGVRVIATASRAESEEWVRQLGADAVVDHRGDLIAQLRETAPRGIDWILTTNSSGQLPVYEEVLRPFGQIVAIDDPSEVDVVALKPKSLSWHWEFMFARSLHQTHDMIRQHEILTTVADLVDSGSLRSTATTVLRPMNAETLREAHRLVESGRTVGKVVVAI